jgi:class 3 adenylate cyclase
MMSYTNNNTQLTIKIGIHTGRIIAGVIGFHKPQFSLIGDTVNTTSRVCSTGLDGQITLSKEAFDKVKISNLDFK